MSIRRMLTCAAVFVLAGIVTFSPWLIRNFVWTGNPVFPEAMKLLGRGHFSEVQVERWERAHSPREDQRSIAARAVATWNQVLSDWRYGYILLPAGVVAGVLGMRRETAFLLALLAIHFIIWVGFTHLQGRFFVLSIPLAGLLLGLLRGRGAGAAAAAIVLVATILGLIHINRALDARSQVGQMYLFELVAIDDLDPFTPLFEQPLRPGDRVILIGEARAFYYTLAMSRLHYRTVFDVDAKPGQNVVEAWMNGAEIAPGQTLLVIHPQELRRFARTYWQIPPPPEELAGREEPFIIRR